MTSPSTYNRTAENQRYHRKRQARLDSIYDGVPAIESARAKLLGDLSGLSGEQESLCSAEIEAACAVLRERKDERLGRVEYRTREFTTDARHGVAIVRDR